MRKVVWLVFLAAAASAFGAFGDVVASFPAPGSQAGGLAFDGTYLWFADYTNTNSTIYKITTTGGFEGQWTRNIPYVMGLSWDGTYLWADSLTSRYVYKINPGDMSILSSFYGPSAHMMGMDGDADYLYINDWQDKRIAKITYTGSLRQLINEPAANPAAVGITGEYLWFNNRDFWTPSNAVCYWAYKSTGSVIATFPCPDSQAPDFAIQGDYLWISGFTNKMIYKVDIYSDIGIVPSSLGKLKALFR